MGIRMKTVSGIVVVAVIGFLAIYFLGEQYFEKAKPQKLVITELMSLIRETIQGVKREDLGLEFLYAELKLEVSSSKSEEASSTYVIFKGSANLEEEHVSTLTLRVVPRGGDVSDLTSELINMIKQGVAEARKATKDDFELQRLTLKYSLDVKATAAGKTELKASDISLKATSEFSRGYKNAIQLVFRAN